MCALVRLDSTLVVQKIVLPLRSHKSVIVASKEVAVQLLAAVSNAVFTLHWWLQKSRNWHLHCVAFAGLLQSIDVALPPSCLTVRNGLEDRFLIKSQSSLDFAVNGFLLNYLVS